MTDLYFFRTVAHFTHPIDGQAFVTSPPKGDLAIVAVSPESAARKLYWRLTEVQRAAVDRVIVWRAERGFGNTSAYEGPEVVFRPIGGKLVETERRG